jgi:hypothetical protein
MALESTPVSQPQNTQRHIPAMPAQAPRRRPANATVLSVRNTTAPLSTPGADLPITSSAPRYGLKQLTQQMHANLKHRLQQAHAISERTL